jgi:hypothetical protein
MAIPKTTSRQRWASRVSLLLALALSITGPITGPALAQGMGSPITGILDQASDNALTKLAQPGAFYNDSSVRIGLPGMAGGGGGALSSVMSLGDKAGLTGGLTHSINDAAGQAADAAKPIFHKAIDQLTIADAPGIMSQRDGATQYLRRSAGDELRAKVRPLIVAALQRVGAFDQLDKLNSGSGLLSGAGLNRDSLSNSVTDQALKGIYAYMGNEEAKLRANPLGNAGSMMNGLMK